MWGLSTRQYGQAVRQFMEAYGLEKSAVSEHFIEASRTKLKELMERRLEKKNFCALLIDGTPFAGQTMIAALGIGQDGRKTILGIRQGATENATVVSELLDDLAARGFDFSTPRLYVLDGGKALSVAVRRHAGESAWIQRCQVHKRRNVLDHLLEDQRPLVAKQLNAAYAMEDYAPAKQALDRMSTLARRAAWPRGSKKRSPCIDCACRASCARRWLRPMSSNRPSRWWRKSART